MSGGVEFESDNQDFGYGSRAAGQLRQGARPGSGIGDKTDERGMIGFLIRHHIAKSAHSAQVILVALAIFNFILTIIVINLFVF